MSAREFRQEMKASGFYLLEDIFSSSDLDLCEAAVTSLIARTGFSGRLMRFDMSDTPCSDVPRQIELLRPSLLSSALRQSSVFKRCHEIARQYYGGKAYYLFDHAIYKMPGSETITHWHQDQAYLEPGVVIPSIHFWIPFQDSNINNGTMQFVRGSHESFIEHHPAYVNNSRVLKAEVKPQDEVVIVNVGRGSASVHSNLTLHATMQNRSDHIRKAWIIHFGSKSEFYKRWLKIRGRMKKVLPL